MAFQTVIWPHILCSSVKQLNVRSYSKAQKGYKRGNCGNIFVLSGIKCYSELLLFTPMDEYFEPL